MRWPFVTRRKYESDLAYARKALEASQQELVSMRVHFNLLINTLRQVKAKLVTPLLKTPHVDLDRKQAQG